jgi:uncharacterized lipoprotein YbaY
MRRVFTMLAIVAVVASMAGRPQPATAASATVSGTLAMREKIALSPVAVAVVTLVDQQPGAGAGLIVGEQRIDGVVLPQAFSVAYDPAAILDGHSYALFASVIDGASTYQTVEPVPVITGGPSSGIVLTLVGASPSATARLTGTITRTDRTALTPEAVAMAALIRRDTGTLVARQVIPTPAAEPIAFSIPVDPSVLDPAGTYVAIAAIVDGGRTWEGLDGVPAVANGALLSDIVVPVTVTGATPGASGSPSVAPSVAPTTTPTATPTVPPATPAPTASPTPTASPAPTPTAAPSATTMPSVSASTGPSTPPSASAAASATPTPSAPATGVIRGTLTWAETHVPSAAARAVVMLVQAGATPSAGSALAVDVIDNPGPKPIAFELSYALADAAPGTSWRLVAGLVDGDLAWVTPAGVSVEVPKPLVEGVELTLLYRPDLLKGAVTGTLTGSGLDTSSPASYATVLLIRADTGEPVGFQLISPAGPTPIAYAAPYNPVGIDPASGYVIRGSAWDGTATWTTPLDVPVLTQGNPSSNVPLALERVAPPVPTPSAVASPSATAAPVSTDGGGGSVGWVAALLALVVLGGVAVYAVMRARRGRAA